MTSCGACMIENLLLFAQNAQPDDRTTIDIRRAHLDCLERYDNNFYNHFYIRQRDNRPTVVSLLEQMKHQKNLETNKLSSKELEQIVKAAQSIHKIKNDAIKTCLWDSLQSENRGDVQPHLTEIRKVFGKMVCESDQEDSKLIMTVVCILFRIEPTLSKPQILERLNAADCRIG